LHEVTPSEQRAAIVSFDSLIGNAGGILGQTGLGYLSQAGSIASGYLVGGLATVIVAPVLLALRNRNERADRILGQAGKGSACAAQGIPAISGVDTITSD
jgi:hypothetical protein